MLKGLRTIVYHVNDLEAAKNWFYQVFEISPYFDEPFYVGYNIGGYELGLDPDPSLYTNGNNTITYWGVDSIETCFEKFKSLNIKIHDEPRNVGGDIWVGAIIDPFGNIIGLIQNPEFAVSV